MIATVTITALTERGVQCLVQGDDLPFWLPRTGKGAEWLSPPEVDRTLQVRLAPWLAQKHRQLRGLASQSSLRLYQPAAELGPAANIEGSLPTMAYDNNMTGVLFKNDKREHDRQPLYKGHCEINGQKMWISAWVKKSERTGEVFMSLAFKPADEQREQPAPQQRQSNSYAEAAGRSEPRQGGGSFGRDRDEPVPF